MTTIREFRRHFALEYITLLSSLEVLVGIPFQLKLMNF